MDSLTQIALGAAVGEAALGKKLGNRAMVWGAFGGLLPDFDVVIGSTFMDELSALAFHRGFMHSFAFSIMAAYGLGWAVHRLYARGIHKSMVYKIVVSAFVLITYLLLGVGLHTILKEGVEKPVPVVVFCSLAFVLGYLLWTRYVRKDQQEVHASYREWVWLFFLTIFTHPLLDNFTTFGTQIFQPFSDYRVSFSNISVVDPLYSIWLFMGVGLAASMPKGSRRRNVANWAGIALSSVYMLFTIGNKLHIESVFDQSLAAQRIAHQRCMTSPTILNNFLWNGLAEGDTAFYHGQYSIFDSEPVFSPLVVIPKGHELIAGHEQDQSIRILRWFSNGYYNVIKRKDGRLQLNDLRFGSFDGTFDSEEDYIFRFVLEAKNGQLQARQERGGRRLTKEELDAFFRRVGGQRP